MEPTPDFETLLAAHRTVIERYVHFRMPTAFDADDVIQETYLAAFLHFEDLRDRALFVPWILSIAKNECRRWYRDHYGREDISLDEIADTLAAPVPADDGTVGETLSRLPPDEAALLRLTMEGYKQTEIAAKLSIPLGTVKSRLYRAKRSFRGAYPEGSDRTNEREKKKMARKRELHDFPDTCPTLVLERTDKPFFPVDTADEAFIVPVVGSRNAEGTYRFGKLALVSDCRAVKKAFVHGAEGVKIVRDTFNIRADRMYKNECVWFSQLADEYIRDLGTIICDSDGDEDIPTEVHTFLEEDYDVCVNGRDRVRGRPRILCDNPLPRDGEGYAGMEENLRYTDGVWNLTVGRRAFECVKVCLLQYSGMFTESYTDRENRLVLMRTWETEESLREYELFSEERIAQFLAGPSVPVNGKTAFFTEDRISEYAL